MNKSILKDIFNEYEGIIILKSFLTAVTFFTIINAIILIPTVQIMFLYVSYMEYFLIGIYILMSLNSIFFNKILVETLQNYKIIKTIDYDKFKVRNSTYMTLIIFITILITFIVLN